MGRIPRTHYLLQMEVKQVACLAAGAFFQQISHAPSKLQQILLILAKRKKQKEFAFLMELQGLGQAGLLTRVVPKAKEWFELLMFSYNDERFRQTLRVSRAMFSWLRDKLYGGHDDPGTGRPRALADLRMAIGLHRLATKTAVRDTAHMFGVCEGSVVNYSYDFIDRVVDKLRSHITYVVLALVSVHGLCSRGSVAGSRRPERRSRRSHVFETNHGFPGVCGAMDGTVIFIRRPNVPLPQDYFSRYGKHGVTMHAVCDADLNYLDVRLAVTAAARHCSFLTLRLTCFPAVDWL